ncbi:MAG: FkbM family methyltransferase [Fidelibacterota bacterium]|nr:MAG: FkbM family methyltransferase [Candidatus Neomarinimicrobiota bacterium]
MCFFPSATFYDPGESTGVSVKELNTIKRFRFIYRAWRFRWLIDRDEIAFLLAHLKKGQCGVDIGAYKGAYAYWMWKAVGREGQVFAFEPQRELAEYLLVPGWQQVTVENLALSSRAGQSVLTVPGEGASPGATLERDLHPGQTHTVPVTTLDIYFGQQPHLPISLIKCDVEGHELAVFKGGEGILQSQRPILMFECEQRHHLHDSVHDVFTYLEGQGYNGFFYLKGKLHSIGEFNIAQHQGRSAVYYINNFIFLPSESGDLFS